MKSETFPTVSDVLKRARVLVSRGWCQESLAETAAGVQTGFQDRDAVRFCAVGSIARSRYDLGVSFSMEAEALGALGTAVGGQHAVDVIVWNNAPERTREEVLAAFDQAAEGK